MTYEDIGSFHKKLHWMKLVPGLVSGLNKLTRDPGLSSSCSSIPAGPGMIPLKVADAVASNIIVSSQKTLRARQRGQGHRAFFPTSLRTVIWEQNLSPRSPSGVLPPPHRPKSGHTRRTSEKEKETLVKTAQKANAARLPSRPHQNYSEATEPPSWGAAGGRERQMSYDWRRTEEVTLRPVGRAETQSGPVLQPLVAVAEVPPRGARGPRFTLHS